MGHRGKKAKPGQAQGARKTIPTERWRGSGRSTCLGALEEGALWPQALDTLPVTWHQRIFLA